MAAAYNLRLFLKLVDTNIRDVNFDSWHIITVAITQSLGNYVNLFLLDAKH